MREGKVRAQGPFAVSILAGTFGATLIPTFVWLWNKSGKALLAIAGLLSATAIVWASKSSTPALAFGAGIVAMCMWPMRRSMRTFRWCVVGALVAIQLAMNHPIWFLIGYVDIVGGSSSYHRYVIVDQFMRHFWDWFLVGSSTSWQWTWNMWDTANGYVDTGINGGLPTLVLLIALLTRSLSRVGMCRKAVEGDRKAEWGYWTLGAAVFAHSVALFGITYFDQTMVIWVLLLASISVATGRLERAPGTSAVFEEVGGTAPVVSLESST